MRETRIISYRDFLELLAVGEGSVSGPPLIVQGDVRINGGELKSEHVSHIGIENVTFTQMVNIDELKAADFSVSVRSSNFLGGLCIEGNEVRHISISKVKAKFIYMWRCPCESVYVDEAEIEGPLDLSGLKLTGKLVLEEIVCSKLELIHSNTGDTIVTPMVKTDDPAMAFQFRMAGIPVFMSSEAVRKMMEIDIANRALSGISGQPTPA